MFASFNCVHFRYLGSGDLRFRFYSGLLWKSPKVTKGLLPLTFGASPRLGIPSLRSCSVGPPPSAIHAGLPTAQNLHSASQGGGASTSKAAGELTLGLLSGERQGGCALIFCGSGLVGSPHRCDGGLSADQSSRDVPSPTVGAGLPAMATRQPINLPEMHPVQPWERACSRSC